VNPNLRNATLDMRMTPSYVGVDVGTGSARAGVFDRDGVLLGQASHPIQLWRPEQDFAEQSSDDIWAAVCQAVRGAVAKAGSRGLMVRGVGFDATCSLVALDERDRPVSVSPTGRDEQNVIVWMDHRAVAEAARINATGHPALRHVGGAISPEMEPPKLLWLAERLPEAFRRAAAFYDLPDFLVRRATGVDVRSLCTTVCKWCYQGHEAPKVPGSEGRWDDSFWQAIGLGELLDEGAYWRIGARVRPMGERAGGLTRAAARELGLDPGTAVGVAIIDAHAGGVGLLGGADAVDTRLALIGGTSSCHMAVSEAPRFIPGVWGPFYSAMIPGLWLTEGGQSATGALVDHVVQGHARSAELAAEAAGRGVTVYELLNERLAALAARRGQGSHAPVSRLAEELHVLPYHHGNRSPRADPTLRGMVSGLRLSDTIDDLALLYLATVQAIAHGTRHIVDTMNAHGYRIGSIAMCGGGTKNPLFLREHADATGCEIVLGREPEAVLLGSAMLGAVASGDKATLDEAMAGMSGAGARHFPAPAGSDLARFHAAKHRVFLRLHDDQQAYRELMRG
jgi:FGGY-family pentulose kinase